ncbi:protein kinase [Vulcanisaeta sp. JCM 16159]|uniref:protein kinase domain-containing protein n=1 Tax=Vulcanisaeta sp. JCM 16159 TaxID=1295371 RepID=UPI0006D028A0|nr:protein kinase [Vulcanisaeta sp. JCM 16159]
MIKAKPQEPTSGHITFAWPLGVARDEDGNFRGFIMPYIRGAVELSSILIPYDYEWINKFRNFGVPIDRLNEIKRNISLFKVGVALNLVKAVGYLHVVGHYVGDLNDRNVLVNDNGFVTLIDTDSFFIRDPDTGQVYPSEVGVGEYTAPEVLKGIISADKRNANTDMFSLAVIIFKLLMNGFHSFAGTVLTRESNTIEDNIRECVSPYFGPKKNVVIKPRSKYAPNLSELPPDLVKLFDQAFNCEGLPRPSVTDFAKVLEKYYYEIKQRAPTPKIPCAFPNGILELKEFERKYRENRLGFTQTSIVAHIESVIYEMLKDAEAQGCSLDEVEDLIIDIIVDALERLGIDREKNSNGVFTRNS